MTTKSPPSQSLFRALVDYYHRLETDPDQPVADYGFGRAKIHYQIVLERDGTLASFEDIRTKSDRGKPMFAPLVVPIAGGRSGSGMFPSFCWDNTGYVLGSDNKDNPDRARKQFEAFRDLHRSHRDELADDAGFAALVAFLERWDPAQASTLPGWDEAAGLNVVFKLRGAVGHVHDSAAVRAAWIRQVSTPADGSVAVVGVSFLSGEEEPIARLHPMLSGVIGAQSSGAALVSFNNAAFESYGKTQAYNAPLGVHDAFRYTTALNRLLAEPKRKVRIGDATVVFWSDRPEAGEAELAFASMLSEDAPSADPAEHAATVARVEHFLRTARAGGLADPLVDPDAPFYILGLSPNMSRLSVRYWLPGTVGQIASNLAQHLDDLEMTGARPGDPPLVLRRILAETARESKEISPPLAGALARAVLRGGSYPRALYEAVLRRIRVEARVNHPKAAILKAYLVRSYRLARKGDPPVESYLNKTHPEPAYHCGRMLALLAFAQEEAIPGADAGVVRRNMGAAMATPGLLLGRLQRAAEVGHFPKLEGSLAKYVRDELQSINVALGDRLPRQLDLIKQGVFALGFYQERASLEAVKAAVQKNRLKRTERGEWMASWLEVRVSDILARARISYVYEPRAVLKRGIERWPDFLIEGTSRSKDVYLEVLGSTGPEYEERWRSKVAGYREVGITQEGGEAGRLIAFDWRDKWDDEQKKFLSLPSDTDLLNVLRPYVPQVLGADLQATDIETENDITSTPSEN